MSDETVTATYEGNMRAAHGFLRMADNFRNSDTFRGDRDAASNALATMALGHAALALADQLSGILGHLEDRSITVVTKADRP